MKTFQIIIILLLCIFVSPVFVSNAQEVSPATEERDDRLIVARSENVLNIDEIVRVLVIFVVLSVVFEVALTPIFNWRIFLARFESRGFKTPITVILAFLVFWRYDLDIITDLLIVLRHLEPGTGSTLGGQALTALLIAGGSDGVFRIFAKLGIRNPEARKLKAEEAQRALAKQREQKGKSNLEK